MDGLLQLQRKTEPEPNAQRLEFSFPSKDVNETNLMNLDGNTNRFL
jgi:hypothetical protein